MASLRDSMPATAEAIDQLREVFGVDLVNDQIRQSMKGRPAFYAEEVVNGALVTFGVKPQKMREFPACFLDCRPMVEIVKRGRK